MYFICSLIKLQMYLEGSSVVKQSNETAKKYFEAAAEKGNPVGQVILTN